MNKIMTVTTTMTYANKAKDILAENGILADVRKVQGGTAAGCLYGIVINNKDYKKAESIMLDNGIRIISVREVPT